MITRESVSAAFPVRPLAEVAEFLDSRRKPVKESERKPGPYPYYGANGQQGTIDGFIFDEPLILLAEDGGFFDQPDRGIAYRVSGKTWVNNHAHVIRPRKGVDLAYLCRVLENYDVTPYISGSTRAKLTKGQAEKIEIPLPPLEEQKRIAAILDQADELRHKRQRALDRLNQLGQAIFYEMFGDPVSPDADKAERLAVIAELINGDRSSNYPSGDEIKDSGVLFLNTTNIQNGELNFAKAQFITPQKFASLTRGKLARGDLVITLRGTLGQCALFDCEHDTGFINAQMMIIRCHERVLPRYLKEFISFPSVQKKLTGSNSGSAVPQLTATQMKEMQIIVPRLEDQRAFVTAIDAARQVLRVQVANAIDLGRLFTSLQHRAFRGELSASRLKEAAA